MIRSGSLSRGMTRSSERRKSATPTRSTERVERHVDAGHQDERALAAGDLAAPLDLFLERLQAAHRAGDRVLRAAQVEVHDLQEFAGALGDLGDERRDVGVVEVDLRRPDRGQPVVGPAELVARHDVVHLRAAVEHDLQQRLQFVDAAARRPARCTHRRSGRRRSRPRRTHPARASRRPARRPPSPSRPG